MKTQKKFKETLIIILELNVIISFVALVVYIFKNIIRL